MVSHLGRGMLSYKHREMDLIVGLVIHNLLCVDIDQDNVFCSYLFSLVKKCELHVSIKTVQVQKISMIIAN